MQISAKDRRPQNGKKRILTGYYKHLLNCVVLYVSYKNAPPISRFIFEIGNGKHLFKPTGEFDETPDETKQDLFDCSSVRWYFIQNLKDIVTLK